MQIHDQESKHQKLELTPTQQYLFDRLLEYLEEDEDAFSIREHIQSNKSALDLIELVTKRKDDVYADMHRDYLDPGNKATLKSQLKADNLYKELKWRLSETLFPMKTLRDDRKRRIKAGLDTRISDMYENVLTCLQEEHPKSKDNMLNEQTRKIILELVTQLLYHPELEKFRYGEDHLLQAEIKKTKAYEGLKNMLSNFGYFECSRAKAIDSFLTSPLAFFPPGPGESYSTIRA